MVIVVLRESYHEQGETRQAMTLDEYLVGRAVLQRETALCPRHIARLPLSHRATWQSIANQATLKLAWALLNDQSSLATLR